MTHAYLVLASALVEDFVEECFRERVARARGSEADGYSGCLVSLAARFSTIIEGQHGAGAPPHVIAPTLRELYYSKVVTANNGVRRRNIEALAKAIGMKYAVEESCEDLLGAADALGAKRGKLAHLGALDEEIRPAEAVLLVMNVMEGLPSLTTLLGV